MIRVVNLRNYKPIMNEVLVKVDRSSVLGNPYFMPDESKRDEVCDKYEYYFYGKINDTDIKFISELDRIITLSKSKNIALGCWCFPKRCHGDVIKNYILKERV